MKPIKVLSTDFSQERDEARKSKVIGVGLSVYRTFITPDGQKTMKMLEELVGGSLVVGNVHETIANAARRELVDLIKEQYETGKQELNNE